MSLRDSRVQIPSRAKLAVIAVFVTGLFVAWTSSAAQNVGYHDFSYGTTEAAPTGQKPESKAWFNDGTWWASMYNTTLQQFDIYRLDLGTQKWTDTGTPIDDRILSAADTLWDQASGKLYVVSNLHVTSAAPTSSSSNWGQLYRYTYNSGSQTYVLDSGYPVTVTKGKEEALVLAKDSTGELWVAYVESNKVMVNHSNGSDNVWGNPVVLPVSATAVSVESDDIATIISFGGNKIGVYWSNQKAAKDYFAIHLDGSADNVWQPEEIALGGGVNCTTLCADDHMNMKTDSAGRIYVASKTSATNTSSPLLNLLVRSTSGVWSRFTYSTKNFGNTRPIVLLDESHDRLYFFASSSESGADIDYKITSMSSPSFPDGNGAPFIHSSTDKTINNATSTKQNLNSTTGLLVIASDDDTTNSYVHNFINLTGTNAPTVVSFTPTSGSSGTAVALTGTNFTGASSVRFNGVTASFTVNSATQITATVPATATTGAITVTNSGGTGTSGSSFTVGPPTPTITSISPTSGVVGSSVTITGTNYTGVTGVAFNGTPVLPQNFTINSATSITAIVPSGATTGNITVTNSSGTATSASTFTLKPAITSLSPSSGAIGLPVTINGTSFTGTTSVKFFNNKTATFSVISDTQINTTVPAGAVTGSLTVTTPGGAATSTFSVAPPPTFTSFSPASGPVGTVVTINGTNLTGSTAVSFNGTSATTFTVTSSTKITATVPAGATTGTITVTAPGGLAVSPTAFPVTPAISSFNPTSGGQGTAVTITGTSFTGTTAVKFNGTTATFNVTDESHIAATVPASATTGTLSVTTPGGTATSSGSFTVLPPPAITSFNPGGGGVGTVVNITGSHFGAAPQGTRAVKFNGVLAAAASIWSDTSITVQVPTNATIGPITVTTETGIATSPTNFVPAPVINSFAPNSGVSGTSVLLTGINFTGTSTVAFNGVTATTVTVDSDTSIHATVPASGQTGPISVTTPSGGTGSSASNFSVIPLISLLLPTAGPVGSSLTITGSGFGTSQGASTVTFSGTPVGAAISWGPTSVTVAVPNLAQASYTVVVTVGGASSNGVSFTINPCAGCVSPTINSFSPFEGPAGTLVTLTGSNFTGATIVTFNGTAGNFQITSDTQITTTVPGGATTGPISVTNGIGTTQSSTNFIISSLLQNMTFENGLLVDATTGGDAVGGSSSGSLVLDTVNPIKGADSAHVPGISDAYVQKTLSPTADDAYATFYLRINASHATPVLVAQFSASGSAPAGGLIGQITVTAANKLRLQNNGTQIGALSATLTVGQTYRVLLHEKKGTSSNAVLEAYFAQGDSSLTTPFAASTAESFTTAANLFQIGNLSLTTNTADLTFDNVQIDSATPQGAMAPLINSLTPNNGLPGDSIVIAGLNFGSAQGNGTVKFGATTALGSDIVSWADTSISVKVPAGASSGNVVVTNTNNVASNAVPFTVNGATISGISPTSGAIGATVTIAGTGLDTVTQATINGTPASVVPASATQIRLTVAAGTSGTGPVVLTSPSGTVSSAPTNFTVASAPVITGLSAPSGPVGQSITITGTDFGPNQVTGSKVTFNGTTAAVTTWGDASIVVPVPAGATSGNIVVSTAGVDSNGSAFAVTPAITNLSPNTGQIGASVTITGTSFGATQGGSTVTFGGVQTNPPSGVNWTDTSITVPVPNGVSTGTVGVVVMVGHPSNSVNFTVVPPPSISNLSAGSGPVGSSVTINGSSFGVSQGTSTVKFGTQTAVINTWTDTSIAVTVPAFATAGSVNAVVTVGGVDSNNSPFIVLPNITGVSPSSGPANTAVIINGTTFSSSQGTVTFSGTTATNVTGWSPTSISVTVPVGTATGLGSIVVTTGGQQSNGFNFTVLPPPSVTGVSPNSGWAGSTVTVQGANFGASQGTSTVRFNGTVATLAGTWTDKSIPVIVPAIATGPASVVVTVSNQPSNNGSFTVVVIPNPPTINSFTPTSGTKGTTVTVSGAFFSNATDVKFNGTPAASFHVDSPTQITTIVPAGVTTGPISVTNTAGTTDSSTNFTVSLIKLSTFENGTLTDPATGVTSTSGSGVSIETISPLKGQFSGHVTAGSSWLQDTFAGKDDVYASFYLRLNALPSGAVRIAMFSDGGTTVGNLNLTTAGALTLRNNTTNIATSSSLVVGQIYRVALHQKKGTGNNAVLEGFLVQRDAAFSVPFASLSTGTWTTQADTFKLGATIGTAVDLAADNIQIDTTLPFSAPAPSISGFNPTNGSVGTSVTITGTNFGATQSGGSVKFNGVTAATTWSNASLVATVPAGAATGPITVITAGGTASTINLGTPNFTVGATPTVTSFTPAAGLTGATVVISGTGFTGASAVKFNGTMASPYMVDNDGQITTTVPAGATSGLITVTTSNETGTSANPFTVGAPTVTNFTPSGGPITTSITITGTNFGSPQGSSQLKFNGTPATNITSWSDSTIIAQVPSGATTGLVSVATAAGTGTSVNSFTVGAVPVVNSFTPTAGLINASIVVSGTGFTGATQVKFNGTSSSFAVDSDIQISATVPGGAGSGTISVTTPTGTGTSVNPFTVGAPNLTGFTPTSGPVGTSVTISGSNFASPQGSNTVSFNGTAASAITNWTDSSITATVPSGVTTGNVSVTTAAGTGTSPGAFTVTVPPTISGSSPVSGVVGASVVISGAALTGATQVKFNGTAALSFTVDSDIQITATVPNGATTGTISVTTAGGTGSSASSFTVLPPPPSISSFSPTSGPVGTQVTINGSNLSNASSVTIGGVAAAIGTNSATQIVATVGGTATTGLVTVTTPGGTADSRLDNPANFIVGVPPTPPTITSFTPTSGGAGTLVTVNGANFTGTTSVKFNGTSATFSFVNDSQLTATVPTAATTGPINVTNGSGTTDTTNLNPANFTITRVKDITFEAGSLTGTSGFGSTTGTVTLETGLPLKGADSMTINTGTSYGTQTYTAMDEIFISFYLRIGANPAGQVRLLRIVSGTTTLGAITLEKTTAAITLRNGTNPVGAASAALTPGTVYRVGIHQKKGTGSNAVLEGFMATGNAAFGAPFASSSTQTLISQTDSVQVGATTGTAGSLTLDDIRLDRGSMPGPSGP